MHEHPKFASVYVCMYVPVHIYAYVVTVCTYIYVAMSSLIYMPLYAWTPYAQKNILVIEAVQRRVARYATDNYTLTFC